jgi:hypothetical protein
MKSNVSISTCSPSTPRLTVDVGPLGHDVGDKAAVVIGRELHRALDGRVDIDPVSPDIAREPDVQEVFEGRPSDRRPEGKRYVAGRRRGAPSPLDRVRAHRGDLCDDLVV